MRYLLLVLLFISMFVDAQEKLIISESDITDLTPTIIIGKRVLQEAYSRLGVEIEYKKLPAQRSINESNSGITDGEFIRNSGIENKYENLVKIPVPITFEEIVVYSIKPDLTIKDWNALKGYSICIVRGFSISEVENSSLNIIKAGDLKQAFLMLRSKRIDLVIDLRSHSNILDTLAIDNIYIIEPPLGKIIMYHYLNKKHLDTVDKLTEVLKEMEKEGIIERIREEVIKEF